MTTNKVRLTERGYVVLCIAAMVVGILLISLVSMVLSSVLGVSNVPGN